MVRTNSSTTRGDACALFTILDFGKKIDHQLLLVTFGRISSVGWTDLHLVHLLVEGKGRCKKEKAGKKGEQAPKKHRLVISLLDGGGF